MTISLTKLEHLADNATPRPWFVDATKALGAYAIYQKENIGTPETVMVCSMVDPTDRVVLAKTVDRRNADADLLVYLANHVDDIIKLLKSRNVNCIPGTRDTI